MRFITTGSRAINLDQVSSIHLTGEGEGAELLIGHSLGWLKLKGPHAADVYVDLLATVQSEAVIGGMGVELSGPRAESQV